MGLSFLRLGIKFFISLGSQFGSLISSAWNVESSPYLYARLMNFRLRFLINVSFTSVLISVALKFVKFSAFRRLSFFFFSNQGF